MKFIDAMRTEDAYTENMAVTNSSSLDAVLDLFFFAGATRFRSKEEIKRMISKSYTQDKRRTLQLILWAGDIRGGAGERRFFRIALDYLFNNDKEVFNKIIFFVPKYNRWDSLFLFPCNSVLSYIQQNIEDPLLCKWLPRKKQYNNFKIKLLKYLGWDAKKYRKHLSFFSDTVEQKICQKKWDQVEYRKVPSVAFNKYKKAFKKNDEERFENFLDRVKKGEDKINAGAIFPHDIVSSIIRDNYVDGANEQWNNLPNYMKENDRIILPVCDTSGSMAGLPLIVCVSLGIYISERNRGPLQNAFMTFSENPKIQYLRGELKDRVCQLETSEWGFNTNLISVFEVLLNKFKYIDKKEFPTTLLIISDMEFDEAIDGEKSVTNLSKINKMYLEAGLEVPEILFWNVNAREGNVPAQKNDKKVGLVSGFSPSILKKVLAGEDFSPMAIMLETLNQYNVEDLT